MYRGGLSIVSPLWLAIVVATHVLLVTAQTRRTGGSRIARGVIAAIIIAVVVPILLCLLCCCIIKRRRRRASQAQGYAPTNAPGPGGGGMFGLNRSGAKFGGGGGGGGGDGGKHAAAPPPTMPPPAYNPSGQAYNTTAPVQQYQQA